MRSVVMDWKAIAMKEVLASFTRRKIAKGLLFNSILIREVVTSEGDMTKVQFEFNQYGRFVDMGVGRGFKIGSGRAAILKKLAGFETGRGRRRKQFYTRNIMHQGHRLHEILIREFGIKMLAIAENTLDGGKIKINL